MLSALSLAALVVAGGRAGDLSPTLAELANMAENHHAAFLARRADLSAVEEDERIALADLLPQASARWGIKNNGDPWRLNVRATQSLLDVSGYVGWRAAADETALARINVALARQELRQDVIVAWLDAQLARDLLGLVKARVKTLREQANRAQSLADVGRVTRADVLLARAGLATAKSQLEQARHDLSTARANVARLTGAAAPAARLNLPADGMPPAPALVVWRRQTAEGSLARAAAQGQIAYLRRLLAAAKTAALPKISVSATAEAADNLDDIDRTVELSLSQALFTGGNVTAQQRRILALLEAAHQRLVDLMRRQDQEVERLRGQLRADRNRMAALGEAAEAAAAALDAVIVGYNNGARIARDVAEAEEEAFDARLRLRRAAHDYLKNLSALTALAARDDDAFIARLEGFFVAI